MLPPPRNSRHRDGDQADTDGNRPTRSSRLFGPVSGPTVDTGPAAGRGDSWRRAQALAEELGRAG